MSRDNGSLLLFRVVAPLPRYKIKADIASYYPLENALSIVGLNRLPDRIPVIKKVKSLN